MALRKLIEINGRGIVETTLGMIDNGVQQVSFTAYAKVINISGDKNELNAIVHFKGDIQQFNKQYQFKPSTEFDAPNFIKQVYLHLKTLPEFSGAEDC